MTALRKKAIHASRLANAAIAVGERVNRLELGVHKRSLDEWGVGCSVEVFQEVVDQRWDKIGWRRREVGIQRMVRGTPQPVLGHCEAAVVIVQGRLALVAGNARGRPPVCESHRRRPQTRLEHCRGTALDFRSHIRYTARSLLEAGGIRPGLSPEL
jgi:hypothetical protein